MKRTQQCCLFLMSTLVWLFLVFAARASGATLFRKACGGPGGVDPQGNAWQADAYYTGGLAWTAANQASMSTLPVPYKILRYSSSAGAPVTYTYAVTPGSYTVTLLFLEPNKTGAGQRLFDVSINGNVLDAHYDVFAKAGGAMKPYSEAYETSADSGKITIVLTPSLKCNWLPLRAGPLLPPRSRCSSEHRR